MNIKSICTKFNLQGEFLKAKILMEGNINNTYKVSFLCDSKVEDYVIQRINKFVFKRPDLVMENIIGISNHIIKKYTANNQDVERNVLQYMQTKNNISYFKDKDDEYWRCYRFIGNSDTFNSTSDLFIIEQEGKAFGQFQKLLADYDASVLHESIPNFHNTELRFNDFADSVQLDLANKASTAKDEIDYLMSQREFASSLCVMLREGKLPLKVTHNDTKCNNILFDKKTKNALAVIDLDTVMPGLVAYDYGDAVRSVAPTCCEDETDLSKVQIDMDKLRAFTKGFVSELGDSLTDAEFDSLPVGIVVMTLELASRFLKDYLDGDLYFKVRSDTHNLERARCQIALAKQFEAHMPEIKEIINQYR